MKFSIFFAFAVLFQLSLAAVRRSSDLENEFSSIEKELERITSDDIKNELENELVKLSKSDEKDENAKAQEKKDDSSKSVADFAAFHSIMKKFDSGLITKGQMVRSLEDFYSAENKPSSDVSMDSSKKCKDIRPDCKYLKERCKSHESTMRPKCAKTCRYCVDCENKLGDTKCAEFVKFDYCSNTKYASALKEYCYKACGYCRPSFVPECSKAKLGCCWDKVTVRKDPEGSNCPVCVDRYRNACNTFKSDCMRKNIAGDFMRKHCSQTCEVCKKCYDEPKFADRCASWKQSGWCSKMKTTMEALCKSTCNMC